MSDSRPRKAPATEAAVEAWFRGFFASHPKGSDGRIQTKDGARWTEQELIDAAKKRFRERSQTSGGDGSGGPSMTLDPITVEGRYKADKNEPRLVDATFNISDIKGRDFVGYEWEAIFSGENGEVRLNGSEFAGGAVKFSEVVLRPGDGTVRLEGFPVDSGGSRQGASLENPFGPGVYGKGAWTLYAESHSLVFNCTENKDRDRTDASSSGTESRRNRKEDASGTLGVTGGGLSFGVGTSRGREDEEKNSSGRQHSETEAVGSLTLDIKQYIRPTNPYAADKK